MHYLEALLHDSSIHSELSSLNETLIQQRNTHKMMLAGSAALPYGKQALAPRQAYSLSAEQMPGKLLQFKNPQLSWSPNETQEMIEMFNQTKQHKHRLMKLSKAEGT